MKFDESRFTPTSVPHGVMAVLVGKPEFLRLAGKQSKSFFVLPTSVSHGVMAPFRGSCGRKT